MGNKVKAMFPDDADQTKIFWTINAKALEEPIGKGSQFSYSMDGLVGKKLDDERNAIKALKAGYSLEYVAEKFDEEKKIRFRMREVELLLKSYDFRETDELVWIFTKKK